MPLRPTYKALGESKLCPPIKGFLENDPLKILYVEWSLSLDFQENELCEPNANPFELLIDAIAEAVARKLTTRNGPAEQRRTREAAGSVLANRIFSRWGVAGGGSEPEHRATGQGEIASLKLNEIDIL